MRAVTGKPIKFAGTGEKLDAIEAFHPERVAGRILGMGDVVSLVEKAAESIQQEDAERMAARSEEHTSELQSLMRISYAVFCLKKKKMRKQITTHNILGTIHNTQDETEQSTLP